MFVCVLAGALAVMCGAVRAERVVTSFDADEVSFSFDRKLVTLRGGASLFSQIADDASRFVRVEADLIEGDISQGRFEMLGGVLIETPLGMLRGESALYDVRTAEYSLRRAGIMAPLSEGEAGRSACGFAYAQEVVSEGEIVYITNGRFTTCSRAHPHYSLEADRFRWNPETLEVVVYGGSIHLYGLEIPVLPKIPYSFGRSDRNAPDLIPFPTYTSRDGLRLGWSFNIGDPMGDPRTQVFVRWRQLRPLQVSSRTTFAVGQNTQGRLKLGLREDVEQDIDRIVPVDRFPEIGLESGWELGGGYRLETDLSAGHYRQRRAEGLAEVEDDRVRLQARLTGNAENVYEPGEWWWWVDGSEALYGDGSSYSSLGAGVGGAVRLGESFAANAELRQWATGGETPFVWDDVDVKTELDSNLHVKFTDAWAVRLGGRYDLEGWKLRAWDAELRRREHCLTWKISYSDISDNLMIGAEINGLFGNDEPARDACPEGGPPDYWAAHDSADDGLEQQTQADTASEAMERP